MPEDPAPARNDDHAGVASEAHDAARTDDPETGTAEDRGAAAERTRLAWRRTALSATGVGLLVARPAVRPGAGVATWLVAALAMAAWSVLTGLAYRRSRGLQARPPVPGRRSVTAYALITAALAVLGCLVVML